jgi:hypothetical protein
MSAFGRRFTPERITGLQLSITLPEIDSWLLDVKRQPSRGLGRLWYVQGAGAAGTTAGRRTRAALLCGYQCGQVGGE